MIQKPIEEHHHQVDELTGAATGKEPSTGWGRGALYRAASVVTNLPPLWPVIDYSTNPPTYLYYRGGELYAVGQGAGRNPAGTAP